MDLTRVNRARGMLGFRIRRPRPTAAVPPVGTGRSAWTQGTAPCVFPVRVLYFAGRPTRGSRACVHRALRAALHFYDQGNIVMLCGESGDVHEKRRQVMRLLCVA